MRVRESPKTKEVLLINCFAFVPFGFCPFLRYRPTRKCKMNSAAKT
jgi:hypothetical protein